jgi:hypothetical protein
MVTRVRGYAYGYYGYLSLSFWLLSLLYQLPLSYFIDHGITYLLITFLPGEVGLAGYICTHLFVVVFFSSRSRLRA